MNPPQNPIRDREIRSISGSMHQLWIPAEIEGGPAEIGRALIAWRYGLSPTEVQTLDLIAQGLTNDELASALELKEVKSVKNRVQGILDKMRVKNRTRAAVIAAHYGLGSAPESSSQSGRILPPLPHLSGSATLRRPLASARLRDVDSKEPNAERSGG